MSRSPIRSLSSVLVRCEGEGEGEGFVVDDLVGGGGVEVGEGLVEMWEEERGRVEGGWRRVGRDIWRVEDRRDKEWEESLTPVVPELWRWLDLLWRV